MKFEVPTNDEARIYNDRGIKVSRLKNHLKLWNDSDMIKHTELDFSNRIARCTYDDLVYIVNDKGGRMVLKITQADSESHGRDIDNIVFEWKILA